MSITMFSDLVEENGRTVRENNLKLGHKIPLGSRVKVEVGVEGAYNQASGTDRVPVTMELYVVEHTRDCDGTPMYTYGTMPFPPAKSAHDIFAPTYFGREPVYYRNYSEGYHETEVVEWDGEFWPNHRAYWMDRLRDCG